MSAPHAEIIGSKNNFGEGIESEQGGAAFKLSHGIEVMKRKGANAGADNGPDDKIVIPRHFAFGNDPFPGLVEGKKGGGEIGQIEGESRIGQGVNALLFQNFLIVDLKFLTAHIGDV